MAARIYQQAHSALITNICIQTSHKGPNSSLFERTPSLPPTGGGRWLAAGQTDEGDLREAQHSPQSPSSVSLTADSFPLEGGSLFTHTLG